MASSSLYWSQSGKPCLLTGFCFQLLLLFWLLSWAPWPFHKALPFHKAPLCKAVRQHPSECLEVLNKNKAAEVWSCQVCIHKQAAANSTKNTGDTLPHTPVIFHVKTFVFLFVLPLALFRAALLQGSTLAVHSRQLQLSVQGTYLHLFLGFHSFHPCSR